ncbi:MAG: type II CAAX endopeptidase family protein [Pseudomonadota bacterium]
MSDSAILAAHNDVAKASRTGAAHRSGTADARRIQSLAARLRAAEDRAAAAEAHQHEILLRTEMSRFLVRVLIGLALYMLATATIADHAGPLETSLVNALILAGFAYGVAITLRTTPFPASHYGFTLAGAGRHTVEALLWSLPVMVLIVAAKALLVWCAPELVGEHLFDLQQDRGRDTWQIAGFVLLYAALCPLQEAVARGGVQASCEMFLTGRWVGLRAAIVANLLFAATHVHVSPALALLVVAPGLFWSWLFHRQRSLVGVSVSHIVIGVFAFFVVGFRFAF